MIAVYDIDIGKSVRNQSTDISIIFDFSIKRYFELYSQLYSAIGASEY